MQFVRGFRHLVPPPCGSAVTIGNFDGVHLGHQALIDAVLGNAAQEGTLSTVVLFEPHPRAYFNPDAAPARVLELRSKLHVLKGLGVERVVCLPFGKPLACMPAQDFVRTVLVEGLRARSVVVGDDFHFGAGGRGDFRLLAELGTQTGFTAHNVASVTLDGERVSSTRLRDVLAAADLALAERLLGRPYAIWGRVRHGLELGRKLDMPTANVAFRHPPALRHGIYAVQVQHGGREMPGVASLGVRPTLNLTECVLEDHLFVPPGNLYGQIIRTRFVAFLRPQQKFDDLDQLKRQMHADATRAREVLNA
ncbi:MAG: bifunctional riboflavin kinase/FAD synthetase [Nevskiaceae bacterium]|nr:MAG: bifunctional riboflavin kinase/FAD synthetase [Nevskiaceae bacterium]TBR74579.1 MAG: bifunctional riboflavin kinase/FAD synthetase [Nevskiaceae bacterium]